MGAVAASLARLDAGVSWMQLAAETDERPGWVHCAVLLADRTRLTGWQDDVADASGGADGGRLTGQGLVLDWYLAAVVLPAVGVFHLDRRVPDITPDRVLLRRGPAGSPAAATALESARFACLADDPARAEPGAQVVDDLDALVVRLRAEVVGHAARLVAAYAPTTRIGRHGLWAAVTDAIDVAFMTGGWVGGDMAAAVADARLVLGVPQPPLVGGSTMYEVVDARGRPHWTRRRHSCCFVYRAPDTAECVTCPRISEADRTAQSAAWQ